MLFDKRAAQSMVEYLLILGGLILVALVTARVISEKTERQNLVVNHSAQRVNQEFADSFGVTSR